MKFIILTVLLALAVSCSLTEGSKRVAKFLTKEGLSENPARAFFALSSWVEKRGYGLLSDKKFEQDIAPALKAKCVYMPGQKCTDECIDAVQEVYPGSLKFYYSYGEVSHLLKLAAHEQSLTCQREYMTKPINSLFEEEDVKEAIASLKEIESIQRALPAEKSWNSFAELGLVSKLDFFSKNLLKASYEFLKKKSADDKMLEYFKPEHREKVQNGQVDGAALRAIASAEKKYLTPICKTYVNATGSVFGKFMRMLDMLKADEIVADQNEFLEHYGMYVYCINTNMRSLEFEIGKSIRIKESEPGDFDKTYDEVRPVGRLH